MAFLVTLEIRGFFLLLIVHIAKKDQEALIYVKIIVLRTRLYKYKNMNKIEKH
jgi:hypothetical protein